MFKLINIRKDLCGWGPPCYRNPTPARGGQKHGFPTTQILSSMINKADAKDLSIKNSRRL